MELDWWTHALSCFHEHSSSGRPALIEARRQDTAQGPLSWRLTLCPFPPSPLWSLAGDPHWAGSCGLAAQPGQNRHSVVRVISLLVVVFLGWLVVVTGEEVTWLKTSSSACEWPSWPLCHLWTFCTQIWSVYRNSGALKRSKVLTPTLPSEFKNSINYAAACFLSANSWVTSQLWPPHHG